MCYVMIECEIRRIFSFYASSETKVVINIQELHAITPCNLLIE